jgi:hypothetical protein
VIWPLDGVVRLAGRTAGRAGLAAVDIVIESRFAEEVVNRVLASSLAERAVRQALAGALVDAAAEDIAKNAVVERLSSPMVEDGELSRIVDSVLASPEFARVADQVIDSAAAERLVARVIDSPLLDAAVARLLESEDLWLLVDVIAGSPAVTEAIGRQSISFADQVAGAVRTRSRSADERLELAVRGLVRRGRRAPSAEVDGS